MLQESDAVCTENAIFAFINGFNISKHVWPTFYIASRSTGLIPESGSTAKKDNYKASLSDKNTPTIGRQKYTMQPRKKYRSQVRQELWKTGDIRPPAHLNTLRRYTSSQALINDHQHLNLRSWMLASLNAICFFHFFDGFTSIVSF